jgi:hypothetical protein
MWDFVRPEPVVVKHARTFVSADLLASLLVQYENGVDVYKLTKNMQDFWLAQHRLRAAEYTFHTGVLVGAVPWWEEHLGHKVLTCRRKMSAMLAAYFVHFLEPAFERDMQLARQYLSYGLSTDETIKLAKRCSVYVKSSAGQAGRYESACFCLHTVHSNVTGMVVGYSFMPDKSADAKEEVFRQIFAAQCAVGDAVVTSYVGSDNPHSDRTMLQAVHRLYFPSAARPLDVGDDQWHVMDRIMSKRRSPAYGPMRKSLLGVIKQGVLLAEEGVVRTRLTPSTTSVLPTRLLRQPPGEDGGQGDFRWKLCKVVPIASDQPPAVAPPSRRFCLGSGVPQRLTLVLWQRACEGRLRQELTAWMLRMVEGPMSGCVGELRQALAAALKRLHYLFTFIPHASQMAVYGTTLNEGGHQRVNRRFKIVTHMRPDNTSALLKHRVLLGNSAAAAKAALNKTLPAVVRRLCADLFVHMPGVPFEAAAARGVAPYIMVYRAPVREYTCPEYEAQFTMRGGLLL